MLAYSQAHSWKNANCGPPVRRPYLAKEIDFLAACVRPLDVWYVIPVAALGKRINLHFYPERPGSGSFEQYRERWDLLTHPAPLHA